MERPEFLNCIMTPEIISKIRERQTEYDKDPEAWERREKQRGEERQREIQEEKDYYRNQRENNGY